MRIQVRAITRARQARIEKQEDGSYKVFVNTPPVDGAANKEICKMLAKHFGVSKGAVSVFRGQTSRDKVIDVEGAFEE
jgi:uncharacterized protein (TIGR00251 family)